MINKCLDKRKERKWEAGAHNFSLRRVWILARTRQQHKIIFLYSWAKVWWSGGFSDNTALNKCLSWPLIPTPEQQHTGSVEPCCKTGSNKPSGLGSKPCRSVGKWLGRWQCHQIWHGAGPGDTRMLDLSVHIPWICQERQSLSPSPDHRDRQGFCGMQQVWDSPAGAVIKLRTAWHAVLYPPFPPPSTNPSFSLCFLPPPFLHPPLIIFISRGPALPPLHQVWCSWSLGDVVLTWCSWMCQSVPACPCRSFPRDSLQLSVTSAHFTPP